MMMMMMMMKKDEKYTNTIQYSTEYILSQHHI